MNLPSQASSDHLPGTRAILEGLREFHGATGRRPILIHTSNTACGASGGPYATENVYSDLDVAKLKAIPRGAFHRSVDLAVISADEEGYALTYIIAPGLIYGIDSGRTYDSGIAKRVSVQMPCLVRASIDRKRSGVVGPGRAVWPHVHLGDVAALFIRLFDTVTTDPERAGHGWDEYYFVENGHGCWYDISKAIGRALVDSGFITDPEPTPFTTEELVKYWGSEALGKYWGTTCRCSADRARALGWVPKFTEADMLTTFIKKLTYRRSSKRRDKPPDC